MMWILTNFKVTMFLHQELMFEPCRLFCKKYHPLIVNAAKVEKCFGEYQEIKSIPAKLLKKAFIEEFRIWDHRDNRRLKVFLMDV